MEHLPQQWQNQALLQQMHILVGMRTAPAPEADRCVAMYSKLKWTEFTYIVEQIEKVLAVESPCDDDTKLEVATRLDLLRDKIEDTLKSGILLEGPPRPHWDTIESQIQAILRMMPGQRQPGRPGDRDSDTMLLRSFTSGIAAESHGLTFSLPPRYAPSAFGSSTAIELARASEHPFAWQSHKVLECAKLVHLSLSRMWELTSIQARARNAVLIEVRKWLIACQPGGSLWNIFEFQKKSTAFSSTEDFKALSGYCKSILEATRIPKTDAIQYVWSTVMREKDSNLVKVIHPLEVASLNLQLHYAVVRCSRCTDTNQC